VIQKPGEIGQITINTIKAYIGGGQVNPTVLIPCGLFTQADGIGS
jgi:hypothetical protein